MTKARRTRRLESLVEQAYDERSDAWVEARDRVLAWLRRQARGLLHESDESRLDVSHHRIKTADRTLDKLRRRTAESGTDGVRTVADVEALVRDVVGIKVLCKSPRDQALMCAALLDEKRRGDLRLVRHKNHVDPPKESGYRAHHILLQVPVAGADPVFVEVQIKTRLQDAWGELTHEDLYKPGAAMKPGAFHGSVGRAMAAMLAAVDSMADDLALELEGSLDDSTLPAASSASSADEADAATDEIEVRVRTTGPRFALAVDEHGRQGLIPAYSVRRLVGVKGQIDVDEYVRVNDVLRARTKENDKGFYFLPTTLLRGLDTDPPSVE
ncbi:RelA/SpoT domain-containing protein [Luteipulveratus sp. YIM 133132]|uniref:GTP pyrophosphokinase n=1 Tax=Luteipulveratus flavus TaxID=3031728 RepID=UPI0023AFB370|nr:RelA/SpoT domain-containing protein [Luteipulveratus sp. YIM 133132]MDE9364086.1 RelA/SpoT domain-containing protein [Luteipulveratus sp. YIM 133132]